MNKHDAGIGEVKRLLRSVLMVVGFGTVTSLGACSTCAGWQPDANPKLWDSSMPGIPGPGPLRFGNRIIYGQVLKESAATWNGLMQDVYLHMRANPNLILTVDQKKAAAEGTRALVGPTPAMPKLNAAIRSVPLYDSSSIMTHDLCAQVDAGYAALWGWRPYIRLQRISIAAEGTWIIGAIVSSSPEQVVERVYVLVDPESPKPDVKIRRNSTGELKATISDSNQFVQVTTRLDPLTGRELDMTVGPLQPIAPDDALVRYVTDKLK